MQIKIINSGSKGNGYALTSEEEILLLECGVPAKDMLQAIDYQVGKVAGCIASHTHKDHLGYIDQYMRYGIKVLTSDEVAADAETVYGEKVVAVQRMKQTTLGGFHVVSFGVPHHETECDGWLIIHRKIGCLLFITDAEYCPYDFSKMRITHAMIECNYSEDYISSIDDTGNFDHVIRGHMELQTCKRLIASINSPDLISIGLLHLSGGNADAERFRKEIEQLVDCDVKVYVAEKGFQTDIGLEPF